MNLAKELILPKDRCLLMAILNITPDSFSGDGLLSNSKDQILRYCQEYLEFGADLLDIGGESSRPGAVKISTQEEIDRTAPVIEIIAKNFDVPISIDTYKASVAKAALESGASVVNDICALNDPGMAEVVNEFKAKIILMHNTSDSQKIASDPLLGNSFIGNKTDNIIEEVKNELEQIANNALSKGISKESIILDPGFGFGKTVEQNLEILARFNEFTSLAYPLLSGPSRKSFIGYTLGTSPSDRLEGSLAAFTISLIKGASIIRAHDVKAAARIVKFGNAVKLHENAKGTS